MASASMASSLEAQEELVRELDARIEKHRDEREEAERRAEALQEEASKKVCCSPLPAASVTPSPATCLLP